MKLNVTAKTCSERQYAIAKKISSIKENIALQWEKDTGNFRARSHLAKLPTCQRQPKGFSDPRKQLS